ncbi:MAG TPA: hypothetical protein VM095_09120 [Pyrinomonadaceae bacterium]|nr:hypothetical protein [Pyrinomonadaceae bacterium]
MKAFLTKIHELRQDRGCKRQPTFDQALLDLDSTIKPATHPYKLRPREMWKLMKNGWFRMGAQGAPATLPAGGYVYRLCPIAKLTAYSPGWFSNTPRQVDQPPLIYRLWKKKVEELEKNAGGQRVWLRLSRYARGTFQSPRQFSFWTGYDLDPHNPHKLLADAHDLGLPNDWLDEYSVILKCETASFQGASPARIPTTLDGFDSQIFHPRREIAVPPSGVTIKLSLTIPLNKGYDEFAFGPIDTAAIHLYPVHIPQNITPCIKSDEPRLLNSLRVYYTNLTP